MIMPYYNTPDFTLYKGNSLDLLKSLNKPVDMIFADPPYFLSTGNGKININGQYIKFDKGHWDRVRTRDEKDEFNKAWLTPCCNLLKENGTIWVAINAPKGSGEQSYDEYGNPVESSSIWWHKLED